MKQCKKSRRKCYQSKNFKITLKWKLKLLQKKKRKETAMQLKWIKIRHDKIRQ